VAGIAGRIAALIVRIRDTLPLTVPGMIVLTIDAACDDATFRDGRAAFLGGTQQPCELDRQIPTLRPPSPALKIDFKSHVNERSKHYPIR
jgi:hypothetical protein